MNPTYRIRGSIPAPKPVQVPASVSAAIYANLAGKVCVCSGSKKARQSFCRGHYFALPPLTRTALYERDNYPATFLRACSILGLPAPLSDVASAKEDEPVQP